MKSIKEKAEEYGKNSYHRNGFFLKDKCRGCYTHILSSYEAGANYVLGQVEILLNSQRFVDNPSQELYELIEQLKK